MSNYNNDDLFSTLQFAQEKSVTLLLRTFLAALLVAVLALLGRFSD